MTKKINAWALIEKLTGDFSGTTQSRSQARSVARAMKRQTKKDYSIKACSITLK